MSAKYDILLPIVAVVLLISAVCGCGKAEKEEAIVVDRAEDTEYQDVLKQQAKKLNQLMNKRAPAVARLQELEKAGVTEGEEVEKLKAEVEAVNQEIERSRIENKAIVRERIRKEIADKQKISDKTSK